jgi:uncharacterized protein YneF (UPF0154 family)
MATKGKVASQARTLKIAAARFFVVIRMLWRNTRRRLTMMAIDKALLIGWAGVIVGVATGFWIAHARLPLNESIATDAVFLGFGGAALFILLNRRVSDGYRVVYALAIFIISIFPVSQFFVPATTLFLASALLRFLMTDVIKNQLRDPRRTLTMMTMDKALLIGWAGVILGVATGFWIAHTRLSLNHAITTDKVFLGIGGVALFILLNGRVSGGYRVACAFAIFIISISPGWQVFVPAALLFLASALLRFFRKTKLSKYR